LTVMYRQTYARPATVARARVVETGKGYDDKASLSEPCYSRSSMVYETQVQGVQEVQGEQGADSVGQAGAPSRRWGDAADFARTVKEVHRSRDCRLDSQVPRQRTELVAVAGAAVVGEAVVATPEHGSIPHGWWLAVLEQR
jgi:hypothetical protein